MNRCAYPWQQMIIDLTGEVVPCCYWSGYGNSGKPLGNTNNHSIDEIWNNEAYQDLRQRMATKNLDGHPCGNCMSYRWAGDQFPHFSTPSAFTGEQGFCFLARLPDSFAEAAKTTGQPVVVSENGQPLPLPNALHDDIRTLGMGRYSVWNEWLYLATSDNSDPAYNGRFYELKCGDLTARLDCVVAESESGRNLLTAYREFQAGQAVLEAKPSMLSFISTADCNIDCPGCSQNMVRVAKVQHRRETVPDVLAHIPYLVQLIWHGGEPFLIKRLREFIDSFKTEDNPNLAFGFTSNGTMITAAEAEKLKKFPRLNASVSCDSFNAETFHKIRAGAPYERVIENIQRLVAMHDAPTRIFSVGMIICKSNMLELADNLRFAIANDIGLNLSPVVVYPLLEQLNIFEDFAAETRGWEKVLDEAATVVAQAKLRHAKAISRVDPTGMVSELRKIYDEAKARYSRVFDIAVHVQDPLNMLELCAHPAVIIYADDAPIGYTKLAAGQDYYRLCVPETVWAKGGLIRAQLVHNAMEPGSVVATNRFAVGDFPRRNFFELCFEVPEFKPTKRGRNISWANYGETTPEGLNVQVASDVFDHYIKAYKHELPKFFGPVRILSDGREPLDLMITRKIYETASWAIK